MIGESKNCLRGEEAAFFFPRDPDTGELEKEDMRNRDTLRWERGVESRSIEEQPDEPGGLDSKSISVTGRRRSEVK